MNRSYILLLLSLIFTASANGGGSDVTDHDHLDKYRELQNAIRGFLDTLWQPFRDDMLKDPRLAYNDDLMGAYNVMLSPMLVSANGSRTHADAMSAFCYNYFEVGLLMTDDHIKQPVYSTGDTKVINQFQACQSKMKQLQGQCLTTLGVNLVSGIWDRMIGLVKGLIPF